MEINFVRVLISVFGLILLMVPGFVLVKAKLVPVSASKHFSNTVLYICTTVFMFLGFQKCTFTEAIGLNLLIVAGLAIAVHGIMILLLWLIFRTGDQKARVVRACSMFSNCGYMGLPFLMLVFDKSEKLGEIIVYASIIIMVFYLFVWTVGVLFASGDKKEISIKKIVTNPIIIATVISLIIFLTVKVPFTELKIDNPDLKAFVDQLFTCLNMIANMVTPLSMIVIGMQLANTQLKQIFGQKEAYIICAFKLVVMPLITILVVVFLPIDVTIKYSLFFLLAMPVATITTMLTVKYDGDASLSSSAVLLSNILSLITIPVLFLLFDFIIKNLNY